jgi:uncharacterized protein (DUF2062 family)
MAKKILKRWMPDPAKIKAIPGFSFLGDVLHDPNLFHLNRHSVSVGFFVGLFCALLPFPGQLIVGAVMAVIFRCNLPISIALIWLSNPLTFGPIFFVTYTIGTWILGSPVHEFHIEMSWRWLAEEVGKIWAPLFVGSILSGLTLGTLGYFSMQLFWRWHVVRNWEKRKKERARIQD